NSITVSYTGEQWRKGATLNDSLRFSFATSVASITSLNPSGGAAPSGWTAYPTLNFNALKSGTTTPVLDPNGDATSRSLLLSTITVSVPNGQYLALRWFDGDDISSAADAAMAIDDLTVRFSTLAVPEASGLWFAALASGAAVLIAATRSLLKA